MKRLLLAFVFCLLLVLTYALLTNSVIYQKTFQNVAKNWTCVNGEKYLVEKPFTVPDSTNYFQGDGKFFKFIKENMYDVQKSGSECFYAFFPLFPLIWKFTFIPPLGVIVLNFLFFITGLFLLARLFKPTNPVFLLSISLPSTVVFLMPYAEATFFLMLTIGIYGLIKEKYWLYFIGLFLATLSRSAFTIVFLSILCTEIVFYFKDKNILLRIKSLGLKVLPIVIGIFAVTIINGSGNIFEFYNSIKSWGHTSFSFPHAIADWSKEGFSIHIPLLILIVLPLIIFMVYYIAYLLKHFFKEKNEAIRVHQTNNVLYSKILSIFYIIGVSLLVIFFQNGVLNGLFRYVMCTPFFILLLYSGYTDIEVVFTKQLKWIIFLSVSFLAFFVKSTIPYSTSWNFSDFGFFLMIVFVFLWFFQNISQTKYYLILLILYLFSSALWTCYLFNTYISDGWIFT